MKKRFLVLAMAMVFVVSAGACGTGPAKEEATKTEDEAAFNSARSENADDSVENKVKDAVQGAAETVNDNTKTDTESGGGQAGQSGKIQGTVSENQGFMITIEADGEDYVFPFDETQSEMYKDLKAGDKLEISYENGLPTPDNMDTVVTGITVLK